MVIHATYNVITMSIVIETVSRQQSVDDTQSYVTDSDPTSQLTATDSEDITDTTTDQSATVCIRYC